MPEKESFSSGRESEESESRYEPGDYRVAISPELAEASIEGSFPDFEVAKIEKLGAGMGSDAFLVNGEYVFRFAKHEKADQAAGVETAVLPEIEKRLSVQVPHLDYVGRRAENNLRFSGYKFLEGEELTPQLLRDSEGRIDEKLVAELAKFFSELHSIDPQIARQLGVRERNYRRFFENQREDAREHVYPLFDSMYHSEAERLKRYVEDLFAGYLSDDKNFEYKPSFLHGDLERSHIIVDPKRRALVGIIDWGGVHIGDPDYDLWRPYSHYHREFAESLLKFYPHPDPERLFRKMDFFFRAQMIHRAVRPILLKDQGRIDRKMELLRKQALGPGYWYEELTEK